MTGTGTLGAFAKVAAAVALRCPWNGPRLEYGVLQWMQHKFDGLCRGVDSHCSFPAIQLNFL